MNSEPLELWFNARPLEPSYLDVAFDVPHHEEGEDEESRLHQQEQDPDGEGERPQLAATSENHLEPVL